MEIIPVAGIGFCFGVQRALDLAEQAAAEFGHIDTLGPLIHNPQEIARLQPRICPTDSLEQIRGPAVLVRSHGVGPALLAEMKSRGLRVIDATCPFVKKAQRLACVWANAGYQVVIIGNAAHPEVVGIRGWTNGQALVAANPQEAAALPWMERAAVLSQTTEQEDNYRACLEVIRSRCRELVEKCTICLNTAQVQLATAKLSARVDAMVVVGGRNSANTAKLAQISEAAGIPVRQVETAAELDFDFVRGLRRVGVTAGASTSQHTIEEVVIRMSELENLEVQGTEAAGAAPAEECGCCCAAPTVETETAEAVVCEAEPAQTEVSADGACAVDAPEQVIAEEEAAAEEAVAEEVVAEEAPAEEAAAEEAPAEEAPAEEAPAEEAPAEEAPAEEAAAEEAAAEEAPAEEVPAEEVPVEKSEADAFAEEYGDMKEIRRGARVKGVVVQVKDDELLVDIGGKSEGVLTASELSTEDAKHIRENFHVGDEIDVLILRRENQEGYPVLSKRRVDQDIAWDRLAQLKQDKAIVSGLVTEVVKGGVLVDVGLRGFVPASLVALGYVEDLSTFIGKELQMKIIECDKHSNKLVLSAKAVLRNASKAQKEKTWAEIAEGQTRHGVVRRLTSFGAFVDIGGVDGLLHVSEMAWYRVNHPSDLLKEGDELDVFILGVDADNEKISLGLKQLIPNPWSLAEEKYPEGSELTARVMRTTSFGAFLEVEPGVEGLVHISQLAAHRVEKTEDVVHPGDVVLVKVLSVDPEAKRMSLSIKATLTEDAAQEAEPEQYLAEEPAAEEFAAEEYASEEFVAEEYPEEAAPADAE